MHICPENLAKLKNAVIWMTTQHDVLQR